MPTGYTAPVQDGRVTNARDYLMDIARGFGGFIHQRDDPHAPLKLPEVEDSDHVDALREAQEELAELRAMTPDEVAKAIDDEREKAIARKAEREETARIQRERYGAMIEQVEAWQPPTPDHEGVKEFALKQLAESIEFDCRVSDYYDVPATTPQKWLAERIARAERDIEYHTNGVNDARERGEKRRKWCQDFFDSLPEA